jgi:excisionase family DNA binding protein
MMPDVYLTSKDLEKKYQISRSTVDNWKKEGLPFIKIGRSVRFDEKEVDKWINKRFIQR